MSFLWEVVMEGVGVEVNVRMKEILGKPLYSQKQVSRLSFLCDRGLYGVCLPKTVSTLLFEYFSNSPQLLTPPPTLHLTTKQVF